jgi:hypothetical protein
VAHVSTLVVFSVLGSHLEWGRVIESALVGIGAFENFAEELVDGILPHVDPGVLDLPFTVTAALHSDQTGPAWNMLLILGGRRDRGIVGLFIVFLLQEHFAVAIHHVRGPMLVFDVGELENFLSICGHDVALAVIEPADFKMIMQLDPVVLWYEAPASEHIV